MKKIPKISKLVNRTCEIDYCLVEGIIDNQIGARNNGGAFSTIGDTEHFLLSAQRTMER